MWPEQCYNVSGRCRALTERRVFQEDCANPVGSRDRASLIIFVWTERSPDMRRAEVMVGHRRRVRVLQLSKILCITFSTFSSFLAVSE